MMTAAPIAVTDLAYIQPMGLMVGGHVTPIDHGYFYIKGAVANPPKVAPVFAPLDGNVSSVSRTVRGSDSAHSGTSFDDYAVTIEGSCTFRVRFSNLVSVAGALSDKVGALTGNGSKTPNYAVKAGELIGYTGLPTARGTDVWVENDELNLPGFINPAQYTSAESWKTHVADFFDYTAEPIKSQLLALDERDAEPRWGKIDYDIDGKLVGNWFRAGSGGYPGLHPMTEGYWDGHLAIVPDGNDPAQIVVSFGNFQGSAQQFAVVGSKPDPAGVDVSTGLVTYQLSTVETYSPATGHMWDGKTYVPHVRARAGSSIVGTVLLQLTDSRTLKVEAFPGKTAAQVRGFDSGAQTYVR